MATGWYDPNRGFAPGPPPLPQYEHVVYDDDASSTIEEGDWVTPDSNDYEGETFTYIPRGNHPDPYPLPTYPTPTVMAQPAPMPHLPYQAYPAPHPIARQQTTIWPAGGWGYPPHDYPYYQPQPEPAGCYYPYHFYPQPQPKAEPETFTYIPRPQPSYQPYQYTYPTYPQPGPYQAQPAVTRLPDGSLPYYGKTREEVMEDNLRLARLSSKRGAKPNALPSDWLPIFNWDRHEFDYDSFANIDAKEGKWHQNKVDKGWHFIPKEK